MAGRFQLLLLLIVGAVLTQAAIFKRESSKTQKVRRQFTEVHAPLQDIYNELGRLRRAAHDPSYSKMPLNDTNTNGIIQYSGNDTGVIFVLTYAQGGSGSIVRSSLYRSGDSGVTFTNINSRIGSGTLHLDPSITVSPENYKTVIFADAVDSVLYISTNEGKSFTPRTMSPNTLNPRSLLYHPTIESWLLAHDPTNNALYVSRNLGQTFTKISDNVYSINDYQWGIQPYDKDNSMIYYNIDDPHDDTFEVDLYTQVYPYNDDTRTEFDPELGRHDAFLMVDRYIFAQKTVNLEITLWVSADRKPFKQAKIPSTEGHQNYIVDSIKSVQALVIVQHDSGQYNLYMSEEMGVLYTLALPDIVVDNGIDLELIESMNYTTYIANQNVPGTVSDVRTLISFDVGGNWDTLRPPETDVNGDVVECVQPLCSLHLHMSTSEYWRTGVYSQASAPGIIIAHGAAAAKLNDNDTNLYISRDGGVTWYQTLSGTWGVSILDHGGLIVAARDYHNGVVKSRTLSYTCNEGMSWSDLTFTSQNTYVYGVITEPGETTTIVSLYAVEASGWVIIHVNFSNIFDGKCGDDDYYDWTPYDENSDTGCLLGASITIERRKASQCCLNGKKYVREVSYSLCECTEDDFECDYGYMHANGYSGPCVRDDSITLDTPCNNGELTFLQSQGYHKIGGDLCSGGVEESYVAVQLPCCYENNSDSASSSTSSSQSIAIVLGVVLLIALLVIACFSTIMIIIIFKLIKTKNSTRYGRVPTEERFAYHREDSPIQLTETGPGVQNVNFVDDDDDDKPLTL